ncbi:MAG: hypothetical protein Q9P01_03105 [Anaerolineae bacterium]|nr:hypothetical protein [Anaerolineae bacterium]MDQ7033842.1 hypothetical protein [Anaerolineae bacterium]
MATDLPVAVFEIKNYMVIFRQLEERDFDGVIAQIRGLVRCTGIGTQDNSDYRLDVYFLSSDSDYPAPQVNLEDKQGSIFMPVDNMMMFVDVLRNEKPIFGHLRADNPNWTSVTTTNEPVGAGDEDFA